MTTLLPLYAEALRRGDLPMEWKSRAMPDVVIAQQQFVRFPVAGESVPSPSGWSSAKDAVACTSTAMVRAEQLLPFTFECRHSLLFRSGSGGTLWRLRAFCTGARPAWAACQSTETAPRAP